MYWMDNINVVLCLAGKGQRFVDAGINQPKFLLKNNENESILELILNNLLKARIKKIFLLLNKRHLHYETEIREIASKYKRIKSEIFFINDTNGQADTAFIGVNLILDIHPSIKFEPVAFHNGDTIICNRQFNKFFDDDDYDWIGMIDTFYSNDPAFSYVKSNSKEIIEIKEKQVISNMATTGFYLFKNFNTYIEIYKECNFHGHESYISDIYRKIIAKGLKIYNLHNENPKDTIVLGTPEEYFNWLKSG